MVHYQCNQRKPHLAARCQSAKNKSGFFSDCTSLSYYKHFFRVCGVYLEFTWHYELWSVHTDEGVHAAEDEDGQDDRKVTDELPHLEGRNIHSRFNRVLFKLVAAVTCLCV